MRWSTRLGRFAGIDVYLHFTFLLLLGFIAYVQMVEHRSARAAAGALVFFCAVFACVLLHEFGHALTARRFGIRTRDITLLPIGGVARLERLPENPMQELWVALAGPAVNVGILVVLALWLLVTGGRIETYTMDLTRGSFAARLMVVNLMLVLFNMIPAFPMDGGRVLRALLATRLEYTRATDVAAGLGRGISILFALAGLAGLGGGGGNPFLVFIAIFVWFGAGQEAGMARMRARVRTQMNVSPGLPPVLR